MTAGTSCIVDNLASPYRTDVPSSAARWGLKFGTTCLDPSEPASVTRELVLIPSHILVDMIDSCDRRKSKTSRIAFTRQVVFELASY